MWRSIAAFLPDTLFILDLTTQEISHINHANFLGYRSVDLFSTPVFWSKLHPDEHALFKEHRDRSAVLPDGESLEIEHRLLDSGGRWAWVRNRTAIVERLADGRPSTMMVVLTDITAEKEAEFAHRALETQMRDILSLAADAVVVIDSAYRVVLFNSAAEKVFDYASEEVINQPMEMLIPQTVQTLFHDGLRVFKESSETARFSRAQGLRRDGTEFACELSISKNEKYGQAYFTLVLRDVTERDAEQNALVQRENELKQLTEKLERTVAERTRELERTTQRVTAILNNDADGIILADATGLIQQTNSAFNRLFQCVPDAFFDHSIAELVAYEDLPLLLNTMAELLETEEPQRVEVTALRADNSSVTIEMGLSVVGLFSDDDRPERGIVCTIRDVSKRKAMEQALFESRLFSQTIINSLSSYVAVLTRDGVVSALNASWLAFSETNRDARFFRLEIGDNYWDFTRALIEDEVPSSQQLLNGVQAVMTGTVPEFTFEYSFIAAGERRWHMMHVTPLLHASGGVVITHENISQLKTIEEALRDSEKFIQSVANATPDIIYVYDLLERKTIYSNREMPEILGYTKEELSTLNWRNYELVHEDDRERMIGRLTPESLARYGENSIEQECRLRHKDGSWRWIYSRETIFSDDEHGVPRTLLGVAQDITLRKQNEEALEMALHRERELNELKSRFVSMVSHEYRTPLAVIRTNADLLGHYRKRLDDASIDMRLERINNEVTHMTDLLDEVLFLSKAQAGKLEPQLERMNLSALVSSTVETWRGNATDKHRLEAVVLQPDVQIVADPNLLRVVMTNLLSNAVKYSPEGGSVRCAVSVEDGHAVIRISDEGIGIPQSDLPHLYEDFHRATNVGTIQGTGLGLSITRQMVKLHSGEMSMESEVDKGTTVTVRLPLTLTLPPAKPESDSEPIMMRK
jgi:PAS domain S-box-containing protein